MHAHVFFFTQYNTKILTHVDLYIFMFLPWISLNIWRKHTHSSSAAAKRKCLFFFLSAVSFFGRARLDTNGLIGPTSNFFLLLSYHLLLHNKSYKYLWSHNSKYFFTTCNLNIWGFSKRMLDLIFQNIG